MSFFEGIFITQDFWKKINIPARKRRQVFENYFGKRKLKIENTDEAISYLRTILDNIQVEMVNTISAGNTKRVIFELFKIHDICFKNYIWEKQDREKLVDNRITSAHVQEVYGTNRNIAQDLLYGINIWLENSVLLQQKMDENYNVHQSNVDVDLCLLVYVYGTVSRSLSFLALSKKMKNVNLYYGIEIIPQNSMPINVLRYHPVIYYNPLMAGNQRIFALEADDYKNMDNTDFGKGFLSEHGISILESLRVFRTFQKYDLDNGNVACLPMNKNAFLARVDEMTNKVGFGEKMLETFSLDKDKMKSSLAKNDPIIWKAGVNKYRFELRPIVLLEDNTVCISHEAFEQAIQIWTSLFANGGTAYTDVKDCFIEGEEKQNSELSDKLVKMIVSSLEEKYPDNFCDTDVEYDRIFGSRGIDYGDYDIVFYAKKQKELFLIESKYFSDSLNNSGHINDYDKMYKPRGYYEHCRKRYDLVLENPTEMKKFVGANESINMHCLFVSSKPLELELQDDDHVVTIVPLCIFKQYLDGKLVSEEDENIVIRPTISI